MGHKTITLGVDDTATLPIALKPGLSILGCTSSNPLVLTCGHDRKTVSITGVSPGFAVVCVIVCNRLGPVMQFVYAVRVIEEDHE